MIADKRCTAAVVLAAAMLSACATRSTGSVDGGQPATAAKPSDPARITVTESDVNGRKYVSLGDITVAVNKTTLFNQDPTREHVNQELRMKAAELGADAMVLVRYGDGGVGLASWGSLEGKGRAVKY